MSKVVEDISPPRRLEIEQYAAMGDIPPEPYLRGMSLGQFVPKLENPVEKS